MFWHAFQVLRYAILLFKVQIESDRMSESVKVTTKKRHVLRYTYSFGKGWKVRSAGGSGKTSSRSATPVSIRSVLSPFFGKTRPNIQMFLAISLIERTTSWMPVFENL